ncbi:MAG: prolipoprotein diacylglyceryl transferase, partial [Nanoarchaeota archaeon]|nr:prolipoprotein diacylglyceryl transferase [Nanoarchaeota archaeon]MBU1622166.1 prolipoprotein diacylglyceryl transferase [Nanoarchaeota archaeon]MBU1974681.1 prolipoprotein diacylglyceryl transferase [Nanoarchaeota archaeon]
MYIHNLNPTLLNLGPLEIRWYGLVYVLGFFLSIWWLAYLSKKRKLNLSKNEVWDFAFYLMLGVIVGSRVFMIFWQPDIYLFKPWNLFKIWEGGMSFHGGFVGIVTAGWLFCKKKKLNFWRMADILSVPAIFALALGRVANFINGELVGKIWNGQWCVVFPDYGSECRHPSTLYAAGKRFLVFGWLLFLMLKDKFKPGFIFWNFVFFEGLGRIMVDFYRVDPLYFGFTLGQWFSLVMVLIALFMFIKYYSKDWKKIL